MTITLSTNYLALAQIQAAQAGYADLTAYLEHLIEEADVRQTDRQEALAAIREGLDDVKAGRTRPMNEGLTDIAQKRGLSLPNGN